MRESEQAYRKGLAEYERVLPQEDGRILRALANLVLFYLRTNQVGRIEPLEARCRYLAGTKPGTLEHGWLMNALGVLWCYQGRFEEAEAALAEALSIEEHAGGHATLRSDIRANLGAVYVATSRPEAAKEVFREVIRDEERRIGEANPRLIPSLASLAAACHLAGDDGEAKLVLERSMAIADAKLPSVHPMRFKLLSNYANILRALHRNKEAKKVEKQAAALKHELETDYPSGLTVDISELSRKSASLPSTPTLYR
jgi:tetratricopeptide (TPR) repeat protein